MHTIASIDPRIKARRIAVKRAEGRRRLRLVLVLVGLVVGAVVAWVAGRSPLFDVDHFEVNGLSLHSSAAVIGSIAVENGTPLIDVDLGEVGAQIEMLPWVKEARVARQWPGTLRIDVVERVPVALIPSGEGIYGLLDESGVVMAEATLGSAPDLPVIDIVFDTVLGSVQESAMAGLAVVEAMPVDLEPWVQRIVLDSSGVAVGLDLTGSASVNLGDASLLSDKLDAVRAVLAGADLTCLSEIDASVADLTTIRRDPVCEAAADTSTEG